MQQNLLFFKELMSHLIKFITYIYIYTHMYVCVCVHITYTHTHNQWEIHYLVLTSQTYHPLPSKKGKSHVLSVSMLNPKVEMNEWSCGCHSTCSQFRKASVFLSGLDWQGVCLKNTRGGPDANDKKVNKAVCFRNGISWI